VCVVIILLSLLFVMFDDVTKMSPKNTVTGSYWVTVGIHQCSPT